MNDLRESPDFISFDMGNSFRILEK